jgi:hypothetical protein
MFRPISCALFLLPCPCALAEENPMPTATLEKAVTFYASFDEAVRGDFGGGKLTPGTRTNHETEAGKFFFQPEIDESVFRISAGRGIHGGALAPTDVLPRSGRIYFPAKGNIAFKKGGWGGAVSFWLNTDPNKLLKTKFCDPIQITEKGANNGGLWFDFNDASPRDARMGVFPAVAEGQQAIKEDDANAPLIRVKAVGFKSGEWHHVVLNWQNFDTGKTDAQAELYIDGKPIGRIADREIAMNWDLDKAGIYVAVNYLGLLDELAIFGRLLTAEEITQLFREPGLLATLRK